MLALTLTVVLGYFLGSIPFGLFLTKAAGLGDIREIGSGNIGATNVLRTGRKDLALATLALDSGKAGIAVLIASALGGIGPVAGAAAFLGHCFPVWLGFKGGKGVATFLGTLLAIDLRAGAAACAVWFAVAVVTRYSSLSALVAAVFSPVILLLFSGWQAAAAAAFMTLVMLYRHKDNIARLRAGTEPKIGRKKEAE